MKKMVKVEEVEGEGLLALLGQNVAIMCLNFTYAGKLVGVNNTCVLLENAHIVFETGSFTDKKYKDAQKIADKWYVSLTVVESFGATDKL